MYKELDNIKPIKTLYDNWKFDTKKILNRSEKIVPVSILNRIEEKGITSEELDSLGVPVFRYTTQITVHGLFPEIKNERSSYNYVSGYKSIIHNKNLSIGVKYRAVDADKKRRIYHTIMKYMKGWHLRSTSTDYYICKYSKRLKNKEEYTEELENAKKEISHINLDLFCGGTSTYLVGVPMFGYFLKTEFDIFAVYEKDIIPVIENFCKTDIKTIRETIKKEEEERIREQEEMKLRYEERRQELERRKSPILKEMQEFLISKGYEFQKETEIANNKIIIKTGVAEKPNNELFPEFIIYRFGKEKHHKKMRGQRLHCSINNFDDKIAEAKKVTFIGSFKTDKKIMPGWINKAEEKEKEHVPVEKISINDIQIIDYSEKAIAVIGNTKPIKDQLKEAGGRFNFRLSCGPGWIFPKTIREEVENKLKELTGE